MKRTFKFFEHIHYSYLLLVVPLLDQTVPWVGMRLRGLIPFLLIVVWFLIAPKKGRAVVERWQEYDRTFFLCFVFSMLCYFLKCLYWALDHGDLIQYAKLASLLNNMSYLVILYETVRAGRIRELKFMTLLSMIGLLLAGVSSLRGLLAGIEGARSFANASYDVYHGLNSDISDAMISFSLGMSHYGALYTDAALMGVFVYAIVKIQITQLRILLGLLILGCYITIRSSGLGTPMFVMIYAISLAIVALRVKRRALLNALAILGISLLIIFIVCPTFYSFLAAPFQAYADTLEDGSLKARVSSIAEALKGSTDTYAVVRYRLHTQSFRAFCDNPFFGVGPYNFPHPKSLLLGGHSFLLDKMGAEGLPGLIFYLCFVAYVYKFFKQCSKLGLDQDWLNMVRIYLWAYFFAGITNPIPYYAGFAYVMLPGLGLFFRNSNYMQCGTINALKFHWRYE